METTLLQLLQNIVKHPEDIQVEREELNSITACLRISANEEDKGMIIGKGGRTIKALQDIIAVKALKENKRVVLKIQ